MKQIKFYIFALVLMNAFYMQSQDQLAELEQNLNDSRGFVYEGNEIVDKDVISAEKEYRKAISKAPSFTVGNYNLGNALYNSGLYQEALIQHLAAAESASSKSEKHKAFHNAGNILMKEELCQEAVEMYKNALRNDPTDDESRYNLALAKECAEQQGGGGDDEENEDDKKEDENENEDESQEEEQEDEQEKDQDGNDDQDQNEGDDQEDENGDPQNEKDNKDPNKEDQKEQPQAKKEPGKLSPQQIKNLLEAMNNQEKKVQDKINAKRVKGTQVKTEKDW